MSDQTARPPLSLIEAIIPVASLIVLVGLSYYLFKDGGASGPNQVGMVVATMITVFLGWRRGHTLQELSDAAVASVSSGIGAIFILFAVGAADRHLGDERHAGHHGAITACKILSPNYFYVRPRPSPPRSRRASAARGRLAGTIGIGLMGISDAMGLDPRDHRRRHRFRRLFRRYRPHPFRIRPISRPVPPTSTFTCIFGEPA